MNVTQAPRVRIGLSTAAVSAVLLVTLAGCVLVPRGGQSFQAATAQVAALPGVASATVEESARLDGFMTLTSIEVHVELVDGIDILDKQAFVDYLLAVGWSANETRPNTGIRLYIDRDSHVRADWGQIAENAGWRFARSHDPSLAFVRVLVAEERLGPWPGPIPEVPASLLTVGTTTPTPSPSSAP